MEHARCAQCRNPIRGRQQAVHLARVGMDFHLDCWRDLHASVQQGYTAQVRERGIPALLKPYDRDQMAAWLPEAAIDAAAERLAHTITAAPVTERAEVVD